MNTRTHWAILNEPYGRATDNVSRHKIGQLVRFGSRGERDRWVAEAITDYVSQRGSRDSISAHSPEVRARLRQAAIYGPVDDNPDELPARGYCVCGHPYYWLADELAHPALACYEGTA